MHVREWTRTSEVPDAIRYASGCCIRSMGPIPLESPADSLLVGRAGRGRTRQRPVEGAVQKERFLEEVKHLDRRANLPVEESREAEHPAAVDPKFEFMSLGVVGEANELSSADRPRTRDMDRATVGAWDLDELDHRSRGIVDEDELVEDVRVDRPSAGTIAERALENRPEQLVEDVRTVEVGVAGNDDPGSSGSMSLQVGSLDFQPDPTFRRVWFLWLILTDGVRTNPAVHVHIPRKRKQSARRLGGIKRVRRQTRNQLGPFRIRSVRGMNDDICPVASPPDRLRIEEIRGPDIRSGRQPEPTVGIAHDGTHLMARKARPPGDGVSDRPRGTQYGE